MGRELGRMTRGQAIDLAARYCAGADDREPDISVEVDRGRHVIIREWVIRAIMEAANG